MTIGDRSVMSQEQSLAGESMSQTDPFTLSAWILTKQHRNPQARGNLTILLNSICVGCKFLSTAVRRAGVAGNDVLGKAGSSCAGRGSKEIGCCCK